MNKFAGYQAFKFATFKQIKLGDKILIPNTFKPGVVIDKSTFHQLFTDKTYKQYIFQSRSLRVVDSDIYEDKPIVKNLKNVIVKSADKRESIELFQKYLLYGRNWLRIHPDNFNLCNTEPNLKIGDTIVSLQGKKYYQVLDHYDVNKYKLKNIFNDNIIEVCVGPGNTILNNVFVVYDRL